LPPNNWTFVLDNYSLTEGIDRDNSPLIYSPLSNNKTKYITSNLSDTINTTLVFYVDNCSISNVGFVSASGNYKITNLTGWTCEESSPSKVTVNAPYIEPTSEDLHPDLNVSLSPGIYSIRFEPRSYYQNDIWPVNQTYSRSLFNITNNGTSLARTIGIKLNQTQSGWAIECNNRTGGPWINLTTEYKTIYSYLAAGESFQVWCRADIYHPDNMFLGKIMFNITS